VICQLKHSFPHRLSSRISSTLVSQYERMYKHKLFILGDLNARVGRDYWTSLRVLGHHSVGNENSNGSLLLQTCNQNELYKYNVQIHTFNKLTNTKRHGNIHAQNTGTCWTMSSLVTETLRRCILLELCVVLAAGRIIALCAVWSLSVCVVHAVIAPSDAGG